MDLRRRRELAAADVEELARGRVRADVEREEAVRVAARRRDEPVGDLPLDHHDEAREEVGPAHERADHRRRALVRQVPDERHRRRRADPLEGGADVRAQRVLRLDEERPLGELRRKARGERRVDLEREDAHAPVEERERERPAPRADLDDGLPFPSSQGVENFPDRSRVDEEVLTPPPLVRAGGLGRAALDALTTPDPTIEIAPRRPAPWPRQKGTPEMAGNVQELTESSFESTVLKSAKPVLVDFWAVWCGPCRQVAPIVESLATKWGDKVTVTKLNVDDVPSVAERYGIMSIPTLMLFKGGQIVERVVGVSPQASLERKFEPHLN